jgi:hypothetical protein
VKRLVVLFAALLLAGCANSGKVERSLAATLPSDVEVVSDSCSQTPGKTESGYDHWICLLHYPETVVTEEAYRRWDVAVDGNGNVVASSPRG